MGKKIVLLDVDYTLLYDGRINEALINCLVTAGITEVYLFTKGGLKDIRCYGHPGAGCSRLSLVEHMLRKGIRVLKVITLMDPYFPPSAQRIGAFNDDIYVPLMERRIQNGGRLNLSDYSSVETLDYLYGDLACEIAVTLLNQQALLPKNEEVEVPRRGLRLINKATREEGRFLNKVEAHKFFAEEANRQAYSLDYRDNPDDKMTIVRRGSNNQKGIMMEHFLSILGTIRNKAEIYFFEDTIEYIEAIREVVETQNSNLHTEMKLYTCLMPENIEAAQHPLYRAAYARCLNGQNVTEKIVVTYDSLDDAAENTQQISPFFLLKILCCPVTKISAAILLVVALATFTGITTHADPLSPKILVGTGAALLISTGFFMSHRLLGQQNNPEERVNSTCN